VRDLSDAIGFPEVALSVALVVIGIVISRMRRVGLEGQIGIALFRSFAQLLAVGYVLDFVFRGHGGLTAVVLAFMVAAAAFTSGGRARGVPEARWVAGAAVAVATASTLGLLAALDIVPVVARAMVPLGSMVISNAMVTTSLVMTSLYDGLADDRREVEARLSLSETGREAASPWVRRALRTGMLPIVDNTKVVGLVALPGAMTGMILAGASPLDAIRLQLVVMYLILGGNAFAALVAGELTVRRLFTPAHQLARGVRRAATG
jgi:putative ABC transport system permease protein